MHKLFCIFSWEMVTTFIFHQTIPWFSEKAEGECQSVLVPRPQSNCLAICESSVAIFPALSPDMSQGQGWYSPGSPLEDQQSKEQLPSLCPVLP